MQNPSFGKLGLFRKLNNFFRVGSLETLVLAPSLLELRLAIARAE
jgi:hypothetical protein